MRRTNTITKFHKNAPGRLISLYKKSGGNCYKVARELGVNAASVWALLKNGKEPRREEVRRKMFFKHRLSKQELAQRKEARQRKKELLDREVKKYFEKVMEVINEQ